MANHEQASAKLLSIWNGEEDLDELDPIVSAGYVGHNGSIDRDLAQLKLDITAYRLSAPDVRFMIEHRLEAGDFTATRLSAHATDALGAATSATGLNISRWEGALLAEEWAVWESLAGPDRGR